jgi:hypothetical protein
MAMMLPSAILLQKLRVSCVSDDDPELAGVMKRLLLQDSAKTDKSHVAAQSRAEPFTERSHNINTQGKSESDELRKRSSESGSLESSLSSDSDSSSSSSDDDSSTSSSSSESEASQKH